MSTLALRAALKVLVPLVEYVFNLVKEDIINPDDKLAIQNALDVLKKIYGKLKDIV